MILPKRGTFFLSLTRHTSESFNRNRHNRNRRIGLYESPCLEVINLVLVSLSPRILNRQHAHKQTKELGHDGNGQSTFSGSNRKSLSLSNHISVWLPWISLKSFLSISVNSCLGLLLSFHLGVYDIPDTVKGIPVVGFVLVVRPGTGSRSRGSGEREGGKARRDENVPTELFESLIAWKKEFTAKSTMRVNFKEQSAGSARCFLPML